jgi:uncharacterized protein (TIGR04255 family)
MSDSNTLTNPPVIEAIIDLIFGNNLVPEHLHAIKSYFEKKAERSENYNGYELEIKKDQNELPSVRKVNDGSTRYFFSGGTFLVLVKPNGLTFSMLRPYQGFDFFSQLVKVECSNIGLEKICKIKRVGVRYINVFLAPVKSEYAREYLNYMPAWPAEIEAQPQDFVSRVALPLKELNATCILSQSSIPQKEINGTQITVDLDFFKTFDSQIELNSIWTEISALKVKLNHIFFRSVSRKALDLFL